MSKHSKIPDDLSNLDADILTFLADQDSNVPEQSLFDDDIDQPVSSVRESFDSSATLYPEFVPSDNSSVTDREINLSSL